MSLSRYLQKKIEYHPEVFIAGLIVGFGVLSRIIFWLIFHPQDIPEPRPLSFYEIALHHNFIDYLNYFHTKPIGMPILDKLILLFTEQIVYGRLLLISVLDILASVMLFCFMQRSYSHFKLNTIIAFFFSLTLIGWEFWRKSNHFDHANVFLFMLIGWSYFEFIRTLNFKTAVNFTLSLVVLSLFHSLGFLITLGLVTLIMINNIRALNMKVMAVLMVSIVLTNLPNVKNYIQFGVFSPSTVGGQNAFQLASNQILHDANSLVNASNAPEWWKWCYREAVKKELYVYDGIYGHCYYQNKTKVASNLDFSQMKRVAVELNENDLVAIINQDLETAATRPWRLVGGVSESNTRFAVEYGKVGHSLWIDALMIKPWHIIKITGKNIYESSTSSLIMYDLSYEPKNQTDNTMVRASGFIIGWMAFLGLVASAFWVVFNLKRMVLALLNRGQPLGLFEQFYLGIGLLSWGVIVTFAMATCCENKRMIFPIIGLSVITFCFTVQQLLNYRKIKKT